MDALAGEKRAVLPRVYHQIEEMSNRSYPIVYGCSNCGRETTVERADVEELHPDPDDHGALDTVLQTRGWVRAPMDNSLYCPDCVAG